MRILLSVWKMRGHDIILYPVITRVPGSVQALNGRLKVTALSRLARESAADSALKAAYHVRQFKKNGLGVPLACDGIYWSVSHKPGVVAGVVSKEAIGIDVEQIKDVSAALLERIVSSEERDHFKNPNNQIVFFRAFTAKEAVLKKTGFGLKGLQKTKIVQVTDDKNLVVECLGKKYWVENFYFDSYLASVTRDHFSVQWTLA